jgi:hypothetical protein
MTEPQASREYPYVEEGVIKLHVNADTTAIHPFERGQYVPAGAKLIQRGLRILHPRQTAQALEASFSPKPEVVKSLAFQELKRGFLKRLVYVPFVCHFQAINEEDSGVFIILDERMQGINHPATEEELVALRQNMKQEGDIFYSGDRKTRFVLRSSFQGLRNPDLTKNPLVVAAYDVAGAESLKRMIRDNFREDALIWTLDDNCTPKKKVGTLHVYGGDLDLRFDYYGNYDSALVFGGA